MFQSEILFGIEIRFPRSIEKPDVQGPCIYRDDMKEENEHRYCTIASRSVKHGEIWAFAKALKT
jgi:hypothetical protein